MNRLTHPHNTSTSRPPGHGNQLLGRPKSPVAVVTAREQNQSRLGDRGIKVSWSPGQSAIYQPGNQTSAVGRSALKLAANFGLPIPGDAHTAIIIASISPNTTAAGTVSMNFYADTTSSGGPSTSGAVVTFEMANAGSTANLWRTQLLVPIVNLAIQFDITVAGATNYAPAMFLTGFLRG